MRSVVLRCLRSLLRALLRGTAGAISHCVTHCLIQLSFPRRQALRGVQHLPAPLHERPYAENPGATHPRQSLGMLSPPVCCVDSLHCVSGNHTADGGTSWIPSTAFRESTQFLGLASPYAPAVRVRSTLPTHHPIGRATALPRGATAPHSASRQRYHRSGYRPPSWGYRPTLRLNAFSGATVLAYTTACPPSGDGRGNKSLRDTLPNPAVLSPKAGTSWCAAPSSTTSRTPVCGKPRCYAPTAVAGDAQPSRLLCGFPPLRFGKPHGRRGNFVDSLHCVSGIHSVPRAGIPLRSCRQGA